MIRIRRTQVFTTSVTLAAYANYGGLRLAVSYYYARACESPEDVAFPHLLEEVVHHRKNTYKKADFGFRTPGPRL